jgi:aspartate carbamoyltransferase catalytic subunit
VRANKKTVTAATATRLETKPQNTNGNRQTSAKAASISRKDLLGIEPLSVAEITHLLDRSDHYFTLLLGDAPFQKQSLLAGRTVANLFFENSTRTRTSFELAARRLGADVITFSAATSSISKGESVLDTARVLEAMKLDAIVVRHNVSLVPHFLASHLPHYVHVINAGDGGHEHPTQGLLDAAEMRAAMGTLSGKRVLIVGDIRHSRVARSNMYLLKKMGANVTLVGPPTLLPRNVEQIFGVDVSDDLDSAMKNSDAIIVLRIQLERQAGGFIPSVSEYRSRYGLSTLRLAGSNAYVLHPGPVNLGIELDSETESGEQSLVLRQVKRGVAVRMAVLEWVFS